MRPSRERIRSLKLNEIEEFHLPTAPRNDQANALSQQVDDALLRQSHGESHIGRIGRSLPKPTNLPLVRGLDLAVIDALEEAWEVLHRAR